MESNTYFEVPLFNEQGLNNLSSPVGHSFGTAVGAWGDVLIDLGIFKGKLGRGNLILATLQKDVKEFCEYQPFIDKVYEINLKDQEDFLAIYHSICECARSIPDTFLQRLRDRAGVSAQEEVFRTSLDWAVRDSKKVYHYEGLKIPRKYWEEAFRLYNDFPLGKSLLIQLYSINSSPLEDHWDKWGEAISYILNFTDYNVIIVGKGWKYICQESPRVINLLDKTSSMITVFALANMVDKVLTTANSLSHFCKIQNLDMMLVGNKPLKNKESYFRKFLEVDNLPYIEYNDNIETFIGENFKWLL